MLSLWRRLTRGDPVIDTDFDFRDDTPPGRDPDALSPTLRRYHRLLWSKPLPNGHELALTDTKSGVYLHHASESGVFSLSSDTVVPSLWKQKRVREVIPQLPPGRLDRFRHMIYTIGGMMVFPSNMVDRKMTINGARGCHPRIKDRFDLTVECIRRYYQSEESPLSAVLERYASFFALFGTFDGYVDFFLLQDIVSKDRSEVVFHAPFAGFDTSPVPDGLVEYERYLDRAEALIKARNRRIARWSDANLTPSSDIGGVNVRSGTS